MIQQNSLRAGPHTSAEVGFQCWELGEGGNHAGEPLR